MTTLTENESLDLQALYAAIGYVVVIWGWIDGTLDMCVSVVFHCCGGNANGAVIPKEIGRKIEFLRTCFSELPSLQPLAPMALPLLSKISDRLQTKRHDWIHHMLADLHHENGKFKFWQFRHRPQMQYTRSLTIDLLQFPRLAKELEGLCSEVLVFAHAVTDKYAREVEMPEPPTLGSPASAIET